MSARDNGGPAFPAEIQGDRGERLITPGMTLRDYFAAKAMHALVPIYEKSQDFNLTERAYTLADAMLEARKK